MTMAWRRFLRRAWWDDERARELESYLDLETDDNIARGMTPDEARAAARRKLGNTGRIREEIYAMNSVALIDWLRQDIRYAARVLRRNPGFTIAAVLTLALGIGGVTVIYSALRNILLDPFPYAQSDRMVNVQIRDVETGRFHHGGRLTEDEFLDFEEPQPAFEYVVASTDFNETMRRDIGAEVVRVTYMTPNTFPYLGVAPLLGRVFTDDDARPDAPPVVVLDHGAWVRMFGADRSIVGQVVTIGDTSRTIVGVMPDRFAWQAPDMWVPYRLRRGVVRPEGQEWWWAFQARLKPGVTLEQASAAMTAIAERRAAQYPDDYPSRFRVDVLDLRYKVVGPFAFVLYTLLAAVSLLLLIACCNVANMLLARATTREREMTVRAALGGGRLRIMAHLLTEAGLLALIGAIGGCVMAWAGIKAVAAILPRAGVAWEVQLRLVPEALLMSIALAMLTTLVVGIVPAWNASRLDLAVGMKESGKGTGASHKHGWLRSGLVVAEVALSLVLLLGAGLLIRSFVGLINADMGVDPSRLAYVQPRFEKIDEPGQAQRQQYYAEAVSRVRSIDGVASVALTSSWPYGGRAFVVNRPGMEPPADVRLVAGIACDEHYFDVVGLSPVRGRSFTAAEVSAAARVAVVSRSLADRFFGRDEALGQFLEMPQLAKPPLALTDTTFLIVGVVEDVLNDGPQSVPYPGIYLPSSLSAIGNQPYQILARTAGDPAPVAIAMGRAVGALDPDVPVREFGTVEDELKRSWHAQPRFSLVILTVFAAIGLLLVAIGVYGVMAYAVSRRSQEFAIRMALGASQQDVLRVVLTSGAWLLGIGIVAGLVASQLTNRVVSSAVLNTDRIDVASGIAAVVVIVVVGVAACLIPARRAARTSPMQALRQD